jgi:hypothetical protein
LIAQTVSLTVQIGDLTDGLINHNKDSMIQIAVPHGMNNDLSDQDSSLTARIDDLIDGLINHSKDPMIRIAVLLDEIISGTIDGMARKKIPAMCMPLSVLKETE